jgi:hypothetical protein
VVSLRVTKERLLTFEREYHQRAAGVTYKAIIELDVKLSNVS